jgi:hypothetical protein
MRRFFVLSALLLTATAAAAQETGSWLELRPFAGAAVPVGDQRDVFKDAFLLGLQGAWEVQPDFHVVGTLGWQPATSRFDASESGANVFLYDVGMEFAMVRPMRTWELKPFFGFGVGARTFDYQAAELRTRTGISGYGTLGMEFQIGRSALRLETRGNVFNFKSPFAGEKAKTRGDLGLTAGYAFHF